MKKKWLPITFLLITVFCLCPLSWLVFKLTYGWTENSLRDHVQANVQPGWTREQVKNWSLQQGWKVIESEGPAGHPNGPIAPELVFQWTGVHREEMAWIIHAFPPKEEVYQGLGIKTSTQLHVDFFFDKDGRLIKHLVEALHWGP
jgi:hypothetical protein